MHTYTNTTSPYWSNRKPNKWLKQNYLLSFLAVGSGVDNDEFYKTFLLPNHANLYGFEYLTHFTIWLRPFLQQTDERIHEQFKALVLYFFFVLIARTTH